MDRISCLKNRFKTSGPNCPTICSCQPFTKYLQFRDGRSAAQCRLWSSASAKPLVRLPPNPDIPEIRSHTRQCGPSRSSFPIENAGQRRRRLFMFSRNTRAGTTRTLHQQIRLAANAHPGTDESDRTRTTLQLLAKATCAAASLAIGTR